MDINTPFDFGVWFCDVFIFPLLGLLKNYSILGFSLFSWVLGLSLIALCVRFVRLLFGASDKG